MNPQFLAHYNRELQHLRESAGEFAAAYPKVAGRLGLDGFACADPYVERLLEGFAFLTARVQLKFDAGYNRFTQHLLDTVYPGLLAPLPAMLIAQCEPMLDDPALAAGALIPRGSALHGRTTAELPTACEFRTGQATTLWPLRLRTAEYLPRPGDIAALGLTPPVAAQAALRLVFEVTAGLRADQLELDRLPLFLRGGQAHSARLYEQLLAQGLGFVVRPVGAGAPTWREAGCIRPMGFEEDQALLPPSPRGFSGHRLLQEYFALPSRFHFVELSHLQPALRRCNGSAFELVVMLGRSEPSLERAVDASSLALHCVPAINLFPKRADRILVQAHDTEHPLVVDRMRPLDHEVHTVCSVVGHGSGAAQRFAPFYAVGRDNRAEAGAWFAVQRRPRVVAPHKAPRSGYLGSEVAVSLVDAREQPWQGDLRELAVDTLCTNRDLPLCLPLGGPDELRLDAAVPLAGVRCVQGPSQPRAPQAPGQAHWQLIQQLSLGWRSLTDVDGEQGAATLRAMLALHADPQSASTQRQLEGLRHVSHRPIHRRLPSPGPVAFGRGVEITLQCDDAAFEGSGAFLLAAVLEQFFARHVSINSFTETVLCSEQRGPIHRWAARLGRRASC